MKRWRWAILAGAVIVALLLGWWWRSSATSRSAAGAASSGGGDLAARDDGPGGPRRSVGDRHVGPRPVDDNVVVTGRVVDAAGAGVAGIDVVFGSRVDLTATSGGDGGFSLTLPAGGYQVRAVGERLYALSRTVEVGATDEPLVIEVSELATARGWVLDAAGKPAVGATVTAVVGRSRQKELEKDGVLPAATTDANGVFEVDVLPGNSRLLADHPIAGHGFLDIRKVAAGDREEDLRIQLAPYGTMTGVVRSPDGAAAAGAEVMVTVRSPGMRRSASTTTGDDGRFTVGDLAPGDVTVDATLAGFAPADPQHVRLSAGDAPSEVTLTLNLPRTLTGKVVGVDGEPVADAKVKVSRDGSDVTFQAGYTDVDGLFDVPNLDGGPHTITVEVARRARLTLKVPAITDAPVDLTLGP